jgi:hypothetical protein
MLESQRSLWDTKIILVCAIIASVFLNGGLRLFNIWLSPTGQVLDSVIFTIWVMQIGLFILLILSFILRSTKGVDLSEKWKTLYLAAGAYILIGLVSIPMSNQLAAPIRQRGYEAFVLENEFLIEAIEAFESQNGRPPAALEELVPDQLAPPIAKIVQAQVGTNLRSKLVLAVPYSSIDAVSAEDVLYSYKSADGIDPWQLQVSIYLGSFQSTRFIYNPDESYSNRYATVGRWAVNK